MDVCVGHRHCRLAVTNLQSTGCTAGMHCCLTAMNLTQSTGRTAEIHCSLHDVVQGSWSFATPFIFSYDVRFWSYEASNSPVFAFLPIFPIQNACMQPTALGLHYRMPPVISCCSGMSKEVCLASGIILQCLMGE